MESNLFKRTVEFKGQDAVDAARIIERNMENKVFIHKLLISAMSLERVYVLKKVMCCPGYSPGLFYWHYDL